MGGDLRGGDGDDEMWETGSLILGPAFALLSPDGILVGLETTQESHEKVEGSLCHSILRLPLACRQHQCHITEHWWVGPQGMVGPSHSTDREIGAHSQTHLGGPLGLGPAPGLPGHRSIDARSLRPTLALPEVTSI